MLHLFRNAGNPPFPIHPHPHNNLQGTEKVSRWHLLSRWLIGLELNIIKVMLSR